MLILAFRGPAGEGGVVSKDYVYRSVVRLSNREQGCVAWREGLEVKNRYGETGAKSLLDSHVCS